MDFYLASKSPRRQQLLGYLNYQFSLIDGEIDEAIQIGETAQHYVQRMAHEKALTGLSHAVTCHPVLGADTTISIDDEIIGKPISLEDCIAILTALSGRTHQVLTAISIVNAKFQQQVMTTTDVQMREITQSEMIEYWHSGEPCDKAGSYAIQGRGGKFVQAIRGSYSSVVGLPLVECERLLEKFISN